MGLFDIFSAGVEKEDAEEEAAAEEDGEGEEEDAEEDDEEDEMQIVCAQPAAEDPEKKYTTFATKNGFEVMYKVDEDGVQQPAGLEKSDEDIGRPGRAQAEKRGKAQSSARPARQPRQKQKQRPSSHAPMQKQQQTPATPADLQKQQQTPAPAPSPLSPNDLESIFELAKGIPMEESESETVSENVQEAKGVVEKETPSPARRRSRRLEVEEVANLLGVNYSCIFDGGCAMLGSKFGILQSSATEEKVEVGVMETGDLRTRTRAKSVSGHKRQRDVAAEEEKAQQAKAEEHAEKKYAERLRLTEQKVKQAVLLKEKELRAEAAEYERQKEANVCEDLRPDLKSKNGDVVADAEIELSIHKEIVSGNVEPEEGEEGKSEKILELLHSMAGN
ncbi:hypothetical protein CYMTET_5216 [Cymbomonas tetramitiformis]|uniref:Uncharacterized protein n=1 Tax=Cymbomonas tetramitiformis TaxID=36881 RepID=A0AAE0LJP6_9CHLO|nr:hypothetical protein CYMTET_5216 [Cymbomonas tetramitiformis]